MQPHHPGEPPAVPDSWTNRHSASDNPSHSSEQPLGFRPVHNDLTFTATQTPCHRPATPAPVNLFLKIPYPSMMGGQCIPANGSEGRILSPHYVAGRASHVMLQVQVPLKSPPPHFFAPGAANKRPFPLSADQEDNPKGRADKKFTH